MKQEKSQETMMISLPGEYKNLLHTLAATRVLEDPTNRATAAGIARELILEGLLKLNKEEE